MVISLDKRRWKCCWQERLWKVILLFAPPSPSIVIWPAYVALAASQNLTDSPKWRVALSLSCAHSFASPPLPRNGVATGPHVLPAFGKKEERVNFAFMAKGTHQSCWGHLVAQHLAARGAKKDGCGANAFLATHKFRRRRMCQSSVVYVRRCRSRTGLALRAHRSPRFPASAMPVPSKACAVRRTALFLEPTPVGEGQLRCGARIRPAGSVRGWARTQRQGMTFGPPPHTLDEWQRRARHS